MDEIRGGGGPNAAAQAQQAANEDVVAALNWLDMQPEVDANRIAVPGAPSEGFKLC